MKASPLFLSSIFSCPSPFLRRSFLSSFPPIFSPFLPPPLSFSLILLPLVSNLVSSIPSCLASTRISTITTASRMSCLTLAFTGIRFSALSFLSLSLLLSLHLSSSRPPSRFLPQLKYGHAIRALARGRKNDRVSLSFSRFLSRNCQAERERERERRFVARVHRFVKSSTLFCDACLPVYFVFAVPPPLSPFLLPLLLSSTSSASLSRLPSFVSFRETSFLPSPFRLHLFLPLHPPLPLSPRCSSSSDPTLFGASRSLSLSLPPSSRLSVSPRSVFFLSVVTFFAYPTERYR